MRNVGRLPEFVEGFAKNSRSPSYMKFKHLFSHLIPFISIFSH